MADVATPLDPLALLMVAVLGADELQLTAAVRSCVVPSLYVPVAVNASPVPFGMLGLVGVTAIEVNVAAVTLSPVAADTPPTDAPIVVVPTPDPVAKPFDPCALLIEAVAGTDEVHATSFVKFCVLLSLYVPVAVNCSLVPSAMLGFGGVIASDTKVAADTVSEVEPDTLPSTAPSVVVPMASAVARAFDPDALLIGATAGTEEFQVTDAVRFSVDPSL